MIVEFDFYFVKCCQGVLPGCFCGSFMQLAKGTLLARKACMYIYMYVRDLSYICKAV